MECLTHKESYFWNSYRFSGYWYCMSAVRRYSGTSSQTLSLTMRRFRDLRKKMLNFMPRHGLANFVAKVKRADNLRKRG
jgi:hypothetical protein